MNRIRRGNSGFTLIELTVVILIMVVVSSITLPRIGNRLYASDLKQSARRLRAMVSVARASATSDGVLRRIACDIPKGRFSVEREVVPEDPLETETIDLAVEYEPDTSVLTRSFTLPSNVKIQDVVTGVGDIETEGIAYLQIEPNGMILGNRIHLQKEDRDYTLVINPLTGRIVIEDGYTIEVYRSAE
ncbi:MAG: prepilin-type N-terminal cleavage/methylation domain-containing protein [bacterium]|nr:prepilin-type N-terminal cleavage/methylation domain-containing protein [bacterium]